MAMRGTGELRPVRTKTRIPVEILVSVGLHVAIIAYLVAHPGGKALVARLIPVTVVEKVQPPRPKPPRPEPRRRAPGADRPRTRSPHDAPVAAGPESPAFGVGDAPGEAGTMPVPVGQTLEAPAAATPSAPARSAPHWVRISDDVAGSGMARIPSPAGPVPIAYPRIAILAGATGSVVAVAQVEADGRVVRPRIVAATSELFAKAALEGLRAMRMVPGVRSGVAVACTVRIPIRFVLAGTARKLTLALRDPGSPGASPASDSAPTAADDLFEEVPGLVVAATADAPAEVPAPMASMATETLAMAPPATGSPLAAPGAAEDVEVLRWADYLAGAASASALAPGGAR